jgi:acetyl esterase/lipase
MKRIALILLSLALIPAMLFAQAKKDKHDQSQRGAMSQEQLRQEPITYELDIPYAATGNPRQRLDLYLPKNRKSARLPVIVFIHGGGWMQGDKSDGAGKLMPFVRTGKYAGVSVGYRLSGEAIWPAQIHDCKAAIRWVRANAAKHGFHPDRIGVWGRSAGGHLVLMLGLSGDVPELEGNIGPHAGVSSKVSAVANFFGVSELLAMIGQPSDIDRTKPDAPEALLIGGPLLENPGKAKAASPITYVTPNDPPVLTVHGNKDRTVPYDQAVRLDAALRKADVMSYFVTVKGGGHGNFGTAADGRVLEFFDKYLRGKNVRISTATIKNWKD